MTSTTAHSRVHYVIAVCWLLATVSLASWWLAIGLSLSPSELHRMFVWEGVAFISLLIAGGLTIVLAIRREHLRRQALETFFLSFTHDLKTSLASVQLQAEGLREDWPAALPHQPLDRLLQDFVRLQIQLENSLFVAQPDGRLLAETIDTARTIARLAEDWPELTVRVTGHALAVADARGFDTVVRNLLQNAVVHGGARAVNVNIEPRDTGNVVRLTIVDDGRGAPVEIFDRLGQPFSRAGNNGGTGIGLFVCGRLAARMHGALRFVRPESVVAPVEKSNAGSARSLLEPVAPVGPVGFTVMLDLPGVR